MTTLTPTPKQQFLDANGNPLSGGKVYTYAAGTTTPLTTYTDESGTTPNTNPVILDSRGEAGIWLGVASYKLKLTTSTDVEIWTVDNIVSASVQALADLSESGGSALVGFLQSGTGAVATTVQAKLRQTVSVKDFGAIANDSSTAAKLANNTAFAACLTQCGYINLDADYYTSAPIDIGFNQKIYGNGNTIYPAQNTRCIRIRSSRWTISDLNIDYVTQQGVADTSAVGILFNKGAFEGVISNILINKAYRGVALGNDVDAADPFVYMAMITAVRVLDAYDWGIYISNAGSVGMTTNTLVNCYVLQSTIGANTSSKGMLFQYQTGGLSLVNCAVDKCSGRALLIVGCTAFSVNGFYTEANVIAGTHLVESNSCISSELLGITSYANTFSGTSSVVRIGGTSGQITVSGREQGSINSGTLYGVLADASGTDVWVEALGFITDSGLIRSDALVSGGRRQIASYAGSRLSDKKLGKYIDYRNSAPTTGTWQLGDETQPDALVVGDPFGYYCAVAGTPGTWVTKGGQIGYRTNAGTPVGVLTPKFVGEEVLNTTSNLWFKATGVTAADWQGL
ncbi:MAG: hypothetical protein EHM17_00245 [Verrucomicrobiaceae bacterium]|nr:MAG: hypothetical protein EHM17_11610 [Verrucomicrobiaceae bacterium]RPJ36050.1 MAG: hypothetical protein EHM17_00245 [Verrucomicrobiaceae bacterium]